MNSSASSFTARRLTHLAMFFFAFVLLGSGSASLVQAGDEIVIKGMEETKPLEPPDTLYAPAPLLPAEIDPNSISINYGETPAVVEHEKTNDEGTTAAEEEGQTPVPPMFLDRNSNPVMISSVELDKADIEPYLVNILGDYGINVMMDRGLKDTKETGCFVSLKLHDVSLWGTVQQVMSMCGLWYEIDNNTFQIKPQNKMAQIKKTRPVIISDPYYFKYLQVTSHLNTNYLRVTGEIEDQNSTGTEGGDISGDIKELVKSLLSDPETVSEPPAVSVNNSTNSILIKDEPENVKRILRILKELDQPAPQVKIEAWIIETTTTVAHSIGVRWAGKINVDENTLLWGTSRDQADGGTGSYNYPLDAINRGVFPLVTQGGGDQGFTHEVSETSYTGDLYKFGIGLTSGTVSLVAEMQALESTGDIHILSQPELTVQDNREATITSGRDINIRTTSVNASGDVFTIPAKLITTITPHISPDGRLLLRITLQNRAPDTETVDGIPEIMERSIDTTVLVENSETIVLGGLKIQRDNSADDGVPVLKDIPLLGYLFKYESDQKSTDELMLIVRATILPTGRYRSGRLGPVFTNGRSTTK